MEAVDVLVRVDSAEHGRRIDLRGQGQLDEDAVDAGVAVQGLDQAQELGLGRRVGQAVGVGSHPGASGRLAFVADVDLAGGVLADDDDGQAGLDPVGAFQTG